jgi:DNA repair exonuclease SbcCD ATPase subunit
MHIDMIIQFVKAFNGNIFIGFGFIRFIRAVLVENMVFIELHWDFYFNKNKINIVGKVMSGEVTESEEAKKLQGKIRVIEKAIDQIKVDITELKNEYEKPSNDTQLCTLRAKQNEIENLMRKYKIEIENKLFTVFTELHDNSIDKNNFLMVETQKIMSNIDDLDKRLTKQDECNAMLLRMVESQNSFNQKLIGHLQEITTKVNHVENVNNTILRSYDVVNKVSSNRYNRY